VPLIDDRGRLFGKINLIDAVVWVFVLLLIPLAYGAFLLFRPPTPVIESIKPGIILDHTPTTVAVTGRNLRPFLRGNVGNLSAQFLVESPSTGEIRVPGLPPGSYDVSLWDEATRVALAPNALTVQATDVSSVINLEAAGTFFAVSKDVAPAIAVGAKFSGAEILAVRPPVPTTRRVRIGPALFMMATLPSPSVNAIIRIPCNVSQGACTFGTTAVQRGVTLLLPVSSTGPAAAAGLVPFVVDQLFPAAMHAAFPSVVTARVRFVGGPEIASVIKTGETDVTAAISADADRTPILDGIHASVTAVSDSQPVTAQLSTEPQMNANPLRRTFQFPLAGVAVTGTVRIPVVFTPLGWTYKDRLVKVGSAFVFESNAGMATGWIVDVKPDAVP
jgi:hypothetical protein